MSRQSHSPLPQKYIPVLHCSSEWGCRSSVFPSFNRRHVSDCPNQGSCRLVLMRRWFTFSVEALPQISKEFKVNLVKDCISKSGFLEVLSFTSDYYSPYSGWHCQFFEVFTYKCHWIKLVFSFFFWRKVWGRGQAQKKPKKPEEHFQPLPIRKETIPLMVPYIQFKTFSVFLKVHSNWQL